jgi:hypothetical protein
VVPTGGSHYGSTDRLPLIIKPYIRVDGMEVWSLIQLERRVRPDAYGRVRGGYISRRPRLAADTNR